MATPEEIKADQDAKAAAAKAAQDAKDAEAKAAKEAKEKGDLAELHTWVARSILAAHQTDHPSEFDKIDPTPAMTAAREFVAAFKAMGSHKPAGPITGLSGTVNKDNNTVTLKWDAPAAAARPAAFPGPLPPSAPAPVGEVVIFDGDTLIGTVPAGTVTYTTGMLLVGPHVFTVARKGSPARSNPFSVTIAAPVAPVAPQPVTSGSVSAPQPVPTGLPQG